METTINQRILMLKTQLGLTILDFCKRANVSHGTLNNIQNGENVSPKTITSICTALNVNREWLINGTGEMFNEAVNTPQAQSSLEKAITLLEDQLRRKDEQIELLIKTFGGKLNFPNLLPEMDSAKIINLVEPVEEAAA